MTRPLLPLFWREIESLFFSPLAYIVLTIFLVLNGVSFVQALSESGGVVEDTIAIFLGNGILFWICVLVVPPLVTMRLIAEERRSGLLEMVLTAPVRDGEVVLAKWLGAMVFQAFLWLPTLVYIIVIRNYGALPDPGQLVTSYLGIACVTSLLTAIGLLFSTVTTNQIVSAVGALTVNLLLFLSPLLVTPRTHARLASAFETVSMLDHFTDSFSRGLLDSAVLAWYGAATVGLLVVATRLLETRRWR